jgi:hypothetical protein
MKCQLVRIARKRLLGWRRFFGNGIDTAVEDT